MFFVLFQLQKVMLGEQFLFDFSNQLQVAIDVAFTPRGWKPLVNVYKENLPGAIDSPVVFGFHARNVIKER
jgi:hypothetical protein